MKAFRVVSVILSLCLLGPAWADVRLLSASQALQMPHPETDVVDDVAIDGGYIIALVHNNSSGQQAAYLYRRSISTGQFALLQTLLQTPGPNVGGDVVMKKGIAAVRIGTQVTIFENSGGTYVAGHSTAPLTHPGGLAISGNSVLAGGDGCSDDAVVYQKGSDGNWGITGRLDDHQGACHPEGLQVDLNYDYALVTVPHENHATAWRRNGTAIDWLPAGTLTLPAGVDAGTSPFVLENSTAVSPGNYVFHRNGSTWTRTSRALAVDFDNTATQGGVQVVDRDGFLMTREAGPQDSWNSQVYMRAHVFQETTSGHFENVALLDATDALLMDVSSHTAVVITHSVVKGGILDLPDDILVYNLPEPLAAPTPVVADFEDADISAFTFSGGQFAVARRGSNDVLAQGSPNGLAVAVANDSDTTQDQFVEADITSANSNSSSSAGLVARYVDANNFYYLAVHSNFTFRLYKRVNGVDTVLLKSTWPGSAAPAHVELAVYANGSVSTAVNGRSLSIDDRPFAHGRAGLATLQTGADFDNLRVVGTRDVTLVNKPFDFAKIGPDFTEVGGNWQLMQDAQHHYTGFAQTDPTAYALAFIGVPTENQDIDTIVRLDSFDTSVTSGWFGLLARYQDPQNYYYAAIRSKNQIQIRKVVNGVTTILAAAPFTAQAGADHDVLLSVINDQLHLLVDGVLVAAAHDDSFSSGQYGLATYRATATWKSLIVRQP